MQIICKQYPKISSFIFKKYARKHARKYARKYAEKYARKYGIKYAENIQEYMTNMTKFFFCIFSENMHSLAC